METTVDDEQQPPLEPLPADDATRIADVS